MITSLPARPVRCQAELLEIGWSSKDSTPILGLNPRNFASPQSITYLIPGIVILVSAILVARMIFRVFAGAGSNTFCCCEGGKAAKSGQANSRCCDGRNWDAYSLTRVVSVSIASWPC